MAYKMIVTDLDDTLLDDQRLISDENVTALKTANAMGIEIVLASGRADQSMRPYIDYLAEHMSVNYYISFNGALIKNFKEEIIFEQILQGKVLRQLIDLGKSYDITTQLYWNNQLICDQYDERVKSYEQLTDTKAIIVDNLQSVPGTAKCLFNSVDKAKLEALQDRIREMIQSGEIDEDLTFFFSKDTYLEVLNKNADKGKAMLFLAERLGIAQNEIIAAGDSFNDESMITMAGMGVVPRNGKEDIKAKADHISVCTNNEHIMNYILENFICSR